MLRAFFPCEHAKSVFAIDYQKLYNKGYRAILFDLDNTLVHHGEDSTEEIDALFRRIHAIGLQTLILSNNDSERIESFLKNIDSLYIPDAQKPQPDGYQKALAALGLKKEQVVCIGDQIFTDIYGANRCGIDSILVDFIRVRKKEWIGFRRYLEYGVLFISKLDRTRRRIGDIFMEGTR